MSIVTRSFLELKCILYFCGLSRQQRLQMILWFYTVFFFFLTGGVMWPMSQQFSGLSRFVPVFWTVVRTPSESLTLSNLRLITTDKPPDLRTQMMWPQGHPRTQIVMWLLLQITVCLVLIMRWGEGGRSPFLAQLRNCFYHPCLCISVVSVVVQHLQVLWCLGLLSDVPLCHQEAVVIFSLTYSQTLFGCH